MMLVEWIMGKKSFSFLMNKTNNTNIMNTANINKIDIINTLNAAKLLRIITAVMALIILQGCKKKVEQPFTEKLDIKEITGSFAWYAFNADTFIRIPRISSAPTVIAKPWTESVRIAAMVLQQPNSSGTPKAFATVNRLGIIAFDDDKINLYVDVNLFSTRTSVGLVFVNNTPVFSMYKSAFFNEVKDDSPFFSVSKKAVENYNEKQDDANIYDYTSNKNNPFLVQFDLEQHICFPIVNTNNIALEGMGSNYEVTDFNFDGEKFVCGAKRVDENKKRVYFSYFQLTPKMPLLSITPQTAEKNIRIDSITQEDYRATFDYSDFNNAPERVKELLENLPNDASFTCNVYTAGGSSPRRYITGNGSTMTSFSAVAHICDTYVCAMFLDGTLFFKGGLYNGHTLNNGKIFAIRLPKLPAGFVYSSMAITGNTLYAAWEENYFYKSAKSGFIKVNLTDVVK